MIPRTDIVELQAHRLLSLMREHEVSPIEVVQAFLDHIDVVNPQINAVVALRPEEALTEARLAEKAIHSGDTAPLIGLPVTIKDTIETAGLRTTAGSASLATYIPQRDASSVARLRSAGAIVLGKTNTPEFAMTYATENDLFGRTLNPLDHGVTPGGSSGGEAAIIAAHGSPLGIGSDLGGSIRVPCNFCGIAGLRPTPGRVDSTSHLPCLPDPFGPATVVGPMGHRVEDIDVAMCVLVDDWRAHSTSPTTQTNRLAYYVDDGVVPTDSLTKGAVMTAVDRLRQQHYTVEQVLPPGLEDLYEIWHELWDGSGGARGLLAQYSTQLVAPSRALARLISMSPSARDVRTVDAASQRLTELRTTIMSFLGGFTAIVGPVAAGPPTSRSGTWDIDGVEVRGALGFGYSYVWSLLGAPCLAVPIDQRPGAGVQIVAAAGQDETAVDIGLSIQGP